MDTTAELNESAPQNLSQYLQMQKTPTDLDKLRQKIKQEEKDLDKQKVVTTGIEVHYPIMSFILTRMLSIN